MDRFWAYDGYRVHTQSRAITLASLETRGWPISSEIHHQCNRKSAQKRKCGMISEWRNHQDKHRKATETQRANLARTLPRPPRIQGFTRISRERHMECAYYLDFCRLCRSLTFNRWYNWPDSSVNALIRLYSLAFKCSSRYVTASE